jgi:hypothetical protein
VQTNNPVKVGAYPDEDDWTPPTEEEKERARELVMKFKAVARRA